MAMEINAYESVLSILRSHAMGERISEVEREAWLAAYREREQATVTKQRAVVSLHGVMVKRAMPLEAMSGASGMTDFASLVDALAADDSVSEIMLDIDSPGGEVGAGEVAAAAVKRAVGIKPVHAYASGSLCSAAYWVAAQATSITATPACAVGSIGVYLAHRNDSEREAQEGEEYTIISSAEKKTYGNSHEPLSDEARAELQREVDAYHELFVSEVATGRGIDSATVATWADGRVELAQTALNLGMIDEIGFIEAALGGASVGKDNVQAENEQEVVAEQASDPRIEEMVRELEAYRLESKLNAARLELLQAELPKVSQESDAMFHASVLQAARESDSAERAQQRARTMIEARLKEVPSDNTPNVPRGEEQKPSSEVNRIRSGFGL